MGKTYKGNDDYSRKWANKRKNVVGKKKSKHVKNVNYEDDKSIVDFHDLNG